MLCFLEMIEMVKKGTKIKVDSEYASRIMRTVSFSAAFFFYEDKGKYTDEFADSLTLFLKRLDKVPVRSVEYHFRLRDFEKWIRETLEDEPFSKMISKINRSISGEELRKKLKRITEDRLNILTLATLKGIKGIGPKWFEKLKAEGIYSAMQLASYSSVELAEKIGVPEKTASTWIRNANNFLLE